jgi:hypothetical protein
MNSPKLTSILLLALVLLPCFHVGLETFRPIGRYVRWSAGSSAAVLDTSSGTVYLYNVILPPDQVTFLDRLCLNIRAKTKIRRTEVIRALVAGVRAGPERIRDRSGHRCRHPEAPERLIRVGPRCGGATSESGDTR